MAKVLQDTFTVKSDKCIRSVMVKMAVHHITSHGEDGSRPQEALYPRNNTKIVDYTILRIATLEY